MEKVNKTKQGRINRAAGQRFEIKVRNDLESDGWIVIKNPNNVIENKFTKGKSKYNPFTKTLMMNSGGFPDFLIFRRKIGKEIMEDLKNAFQKRNDTTQ